MNTARFRCMHAVNPSFATSRRNALLKKSLLAPIIILSLWMTTASAQVLWDDYRGDTEVPNPTSPNYTNFPNGPALQNLIDFAAGGPGNIAASGSSPQINWFADDMVLCNMYSDDPLPPSCDEGIQGRVSYALLKFPEAGNYTFSAAHDDQIKVEFSTTFMPANAADYRAFSYNLPVGELEDWTGGDHDFEDIPGPLVSG